MYCIVEARGQGSFTTPDSNSGKRKRKDRHEPDITDDDSGTEEVGTPRKTMVKLFESSWKGTLKHLFHFRKFPDHPTILQFVVQTITEDSEITTEEEQELVKITRLQKRTIINLFGKSRSQRANTIRTTFAQLFLGVPAPQLRDATSPEFSGKVKALEDTWWTDMPKVLRIMHKAYGGPLAYRLDEKEHTFGGETVNTFKDFTFSDFQFYKSTLQAYFKGEGISHIEHFYTDIVDDTNVQSWPPEQWPPYILKEAEHRRQSFEAGVKPENKGTL